MVIRCGAKTKAGRVCRRRVKEAGARCPHHRYQRDARSESRGRPRPRQGGVHSSGRRRRNTGTAKRAAVSPRARSSSRSSSKAWRSRRDGSASAAARKLSAVERRRVDATADYCVEVLTTSWYEATESRAVDALTPSLAATLPRRRHRDCGALASLSKNVRRGKSRMHALAGSVAAFTLRHCGASLFSQRVAFHLVRGLPHPWDAKLTVVARGLQATGILVCLLGGRSLASCPCFQDLAQDLTKDQLKDFVHGMCQDWSRLGDPR